MESPLLHNPDSQGRGGHQPMPMNLFLNEVSNIRSLIGTFRQNVLDISALHNETLQSYDNGATSGSSSQLEALIADTSVLTKEIRDAIKALERDSLIMDDYSVQNTKRQQAEKLKMDFDKELRAYQQVMKSITWSTRRLRTMKLRECLKLDGKPIQDPLPRPDGPPIPHRKSRSLG